MTEELTCKTISFRFPHLIADYNFDFKIETDVKVNGILLSVILDKPLPKELENLAGFNLEFLPSAYFEKTFLMDNTGGVFPLYPGGPMVAEKIGNAEPLSIASGKVFVAASEDVNRRITVKSLEGEFSLYDGKNQAQNGWYVLRSLILSRKSGKVMKWFIEASTIPSWIHKPMIAHSRVGYHPEQNKTAVIEYGKTRTLPFCIDEDVYKNVWSPTLDIFLPVQMDHMIVNEAYRVWHGAAHLDDALQAPINYKHFNLYAMGPMTGNKYKPKEHIPGLNIGGWFDAGDYDIRTLTQCAVVQDLVGTWEQFTPKRDETYINQKTLYVDIHSPDGIPDIIQLIEHGSLGLITQHRAVGYAINGIIEAHLSQYTHLGDASTITDNLVYNSKLDSLQSDGHTRGTFDDRWTFTNKSTPLNYYSAASLAAASSTLRGYNDLLADECLAPAIKVWDEEHTHLPDLFKYGNTTGGQLEIEEFSTALELLKNTKDKKYISRINELFPKLETQFSMTASLLLGAIPFMDENF